MKIDLRNNAIVKFDKNTTNKEHRPLSTSFKEIEILSDGRIIICEDYYKYESSEGSNVYCLSRNLDIDWFLPLPYPDTQPDDVYVGFTTNGDAVFANTWSCFRVEVDTNSGQLRSIEFTK